jgi:hypothetical protein
MAFAWDMRNQIPPRFERDNDLRCELKTLIPWEDDAHDAAREKPQSLALIDAAIQRSRFIFDLADNFDGEGSPGYARQTWERATSFLRGLAVGALNAFSEVITAPYIDPGPNGSIDLHWKRAGCELLINVPADPNLAPTYYGDDYGSSIVKGKLDSVGNRRVVAVWLLEHQGE